MNNNTKGQIEARISEAIIRFEKEYRGRGPTAMSNLQDHSTYNPTSIAQAASVEALTGSQDDLEKMVKEFKKRRDFMVNRVNAIKGLHTLKPQGAFYCWINISGILNESVNGKKMANSLELTDALLQVAHVAVVPGGVFGDDNYIRLSYATSMENIIEGLDRIENFIRKIN